MKSVLLVLLLLLLTISVVSANDVLTVKPDGALLTVNSTLLIYLTSGGHCPVAEKRYADGEREQTQQHGA